MIRKRAFVLLEVLVAVVIMGIAFAAILRGFVLALGTVAELRTHEQAILLSKGLLQDFELEPPAKGRIEGSFADDERYGPEFAEFTFEAVIEEEDIRYRERRKGSVRSELEPVYVLDLRILHTPSRKPRRSILHLRTVLLEPTVFSQQALQSNQLF